MQASIVRTFTCLVLRARACMVERVCPQTLCPTSVSAPQVSLIVTVRALIYVLFPEPLSVWWNIMCVVPRAFVCMAEHNVLFLEPLSAWWNMSDHRLSVLPVYVSAQQVSP